MKTKVKFVGKDWASDVAGQIQEVKFERFRIISMDKSYWIEDGLEIEIAEETTKSEAPGKLLKDIFGQEIKSIEFK